MNREMTDDLLDEMLWRSLKLDHREPDAGFVARVDRTLIEEERFRRVKAATARDLLRDLIGLAAISAALIVLSLAPGVRDALAGREIVAWGGMAGLLLLWLAARRPAATLR